MFLAQSQLGLSHVGTIPISQVRLKGRWWGQYIPHDLARDSNTKEHSDELLDDFTAYPEERERKSISDTNGVDATELAGISGVVNNLSDDALSEKLMILDWRSDGTIEAKREQLLSSITGDYIPDNVCDSGASRETKDGMLDAYLNELDNTSEKASGKT